MRITVTTGVDAEKILYAFDVVINKKWPYFKQKTGPTPTRFNLILQAVTGRENEAIPLSDIAKLFQGQEKEARHYASSTISYFNKLLQRAGINLELASITVKKETYYYFSEADCQQVISIKSQALSI